MDADRFAPQFQDLPLLAYEWQLIDALGCSEEEYREYRAAIYTAKYIRPKEYNLVPEVNAEITTTGLLIAQIVIGLLAVGASLLFQQRPEEREEARNKDLQSRTGRSRFSETQGIDSAQEVAKLGQTVPVVFGSYDAAKKVGGVFAPAQLVWSRQYSLGSSQAFKGLFVIGEKLQQGKEYLPSIGGIYVGQTALASLNEKQLAVYWGEGRLKSTQKEATDNSRWSQAESLLFGTRRKGETLEPAADPAIPARDEVFLCPIKSQLEAPGFSQVISQTNNTEFGVFEPIRNGSSWKVSWRIVPLLEDQENKAENAAKDQRRSICGEAQESRGDGMAGIGRGYSPLMGLTQLNRTDGTEIKFDQPDWSTGGQRRILVGDEIEFVIEDFAPPREGKPGVSFALNQDDTDIGNQLGNLERMRETADDNLPVGQNVMIGSGIFQVVKRGSDKGETAPFWAEQRYNRSGKLKTAGNRVTVTLRLIEKIQDSEPSVVAFGGKKTTTWPITHEGKGDPFTDRSGAVDEVNKYFAPNFYWPLLRFKLATYRNTREVDVTELGLESVVYNRAAGMCNFQSLPTPSRLTNADEDKLSLREGSMTAYFERTSFFRLQVRPVPKDSGSPKNWRWLGGLYGVTGRTPQKQFNYLRITHMERSQMEFRMVPISSAEIIAKHQKDEFIKLDTKGTWKQEGADVGGYGKFRVGTHGREKRVDSVYHNAEMTQGGQKVPEAQRTVAKEATQIDILPTSYEYGRMPIFFFEVFGDPRSESAGTIKTAWVDGPRRIDVRYTVKLVETTRQKYIDRYGTNKEWQLESYGACRNGENYGDGDKFDLKVPARAGNIFAERWGWVGQEFGFRLQVTRTAEETIGGTFDPDRNFDHYSQIAELSSFSDLQKSCDTQPEHRISYINECVGFHDDPNDEESAWDNAATYREMQMLGLAIQSNNQFSSLNQVRVWLASGIRCQRLAEKDTPQGPSNLFADLAYWLLTNQKAGTGGLVSSDWVDKDSFITAAKFLKANNIFCDGALTDKVNIRTFLAEQAPLNLLGFSITNGQLALVPALPFDPTTYKISTKPLSIAHYFTLGNIVEGSYSVSYTEVAERAPMRAVMTWRTGAPNSQPTKDSVVVRYSTDWDGNGDDDPKLSFVYPPNESTQTTFDVSQWVTNEAQARQLGRYLCSLRQRITHRIKFQTLPFGIKLAPGNYIKVDVPDAPTSPKAIGVVSADNGKVLSDMDVQDGTHEFLAYKRKASDVERVTMTIENGVVTDPNLWGSVFSSLTPDSKATVYQIEETSISEEGLVEITASHMPTDSKDASLIAKDVLDSKEDGRFWYRS